MCYQIVVILLLYLQGPAQDEVIAKLRSAFLEIAKEYKVYTEEERKQVNSTQTINLPSIWSINVAFNFLISMSLQAVAAGGLHVIGTERHESRRIDNQVNLKYFYKI